MSREGKEGKEKERKGKKEEMVLGVSWKKLC